MSRPIKFRAWDDEFKMMFYPSGKAFNILRGEKVHKLCGQNHPQGSLSAMHESGHPIMQFTGLHDKNGKEIYEGDIVMAPTFSGGCSIKAVVEWNEEYARFYISKVKDTKRGSMLFFESHNNVKCEVIGNIYENPDLVTIRRMVCK